MRWTTLSWAVTVVCALLTRPLLPMDETRYLAVAWEMHQTGNFLVPQLNGHAYSEKGPLFFWLINGAWSLFGAGEWIARLVAPAFALAGAFMTAWLARLLWPDERARALAPLLLGGGMFWMLFSTLTYVDAILTCGVLLGMVGLILVSRGSTPSGALLMAIGTAAGLLSKGPVLFAHLLPAVLSARWWMGPGRNSGKIVLLGLVSTLFGLALAGLWLAPAASDGGDSFAAGVIVTNIWRGIERSGTHPQPFWWYALLLPALALPGILWPRLHRALRRLPMHDPGVRLCCVWLLGSVLVLSCCDSKQPHYLLPVLPAFALLCARALAADHEVDARGPAALLMSLSAFLFVLAHVAAIGTLRERYDLAPMARRIAELRRDGREVAIVGSYRGEYTFLARLEKPLPVVPARQARRWSLAHPQGAMVATYDNECPFGLARPRFEIPFRGSGRIGLWFNMDVHASHADGIVALLMRVAQAGDLLFAAERGPAEDGPRQVRGF